MKEAKRIGTIFKNNGQPFVIAKTNLVGVTNFAEETSFLAEKLIESNAGIIAVLFSFTPIENTLAATVIRNKHDSDTKGKFHHEWYVKIRTHLDSITDNNVVNIVSSTDFETSFFEIYDMKELTSEKIVDSLITLSFNYMKELGLYIEEEEEKEYNFDDI